MERPMVEMVLALVFESTLKGCGRKCMAILKAAAKLHDSQNAYEHCEEGLASHSIMFGVNWAVYVTDAWLHCLFCTPLGGVEPFLKPIESL